LLPILAVAAAAAAVVLGRRYRLPAGLAQLSAHEADFLVVGAALICGCFFVTHSVIYRGIFLLFTLPGLAALSRHVPATMGRRVFGSAGAAIVFVLWIPFLESCLFIAGLTVPLPYPGDAYGTFPGSPAGYLLWLTSEMAWWGIITVLLAVLGSFVVRTEPWGILCRTLRLPVHGPDTGIRITPPP
jgi:hypothetical protein